MSSFGVKKCLNSSSATSGLIPKSHNSRDDFESISACSLFSRGTQCAVTYPFFESTSFHRSIAAVLRIRDLVPPILFTNDTATWLSMWRLMMSPSFIRVFKLKWAARISFRLMCQGSCRPYPVPSGTVRYSSSISNRLVMNYPMNYEGVLSGTIRYSLSLFYPCL